MLKWVASQWKHLSNLSFALILIINLLFLVFYESREGGKVSFTYSNARNIIEIIGIVQAILSFIVIVSYYEEYKGVITQKVRS